MGLYNFKPQFETLILNGTKSLTIRARRKREDVVGNPMYLYVHLRTKRARLIDVAKCIGVASVEIPSRDIIFIGGVRLTNRGMQALALSDGFKHFGELADFFESRLPFEGKIYFWKPSNPFLMRKCGRSDLFNEMVAIEERRLKEIDDRRKRLARR